MDKFLKKISKDLEKSFIQIPNTMAKLYNNDILNILKTDEENIGDQPEKDELIEESVDSIFSSSGDEQDKICKIKTKMKNKKVAVDLFTGKEAEKLFANRVDRDIFDLKYHKQFNFYKEYKLMNLNEKLPLDDKDLTDFNNYSMEVNKVTKFLKTLDMTLDCEVDFNIPCVSTADILAILNSESKKRCVFFDKDLFKENIYDIFGEVTINLFKPSIYIHKFKQLIRYILVIKLIENNPDYFKTKNISTTKKAIMIVTDGKYGDFINKLSESKIFSKDFEEKEFISESINTIINCKKFKEELEDFDYKIKSIKENKKKCNDFLRNYSDDNYKNMKDNYFKIKNTYTKDQDSLKNRTTNLLKILKSSGIPFIICYFPKVGGEFPYDLFGDRPIILKKIKNNKDDDFYEYKFEFFEEKSYISKEELEENYLSKKEIKANYLSKKEIEEKYLTIEESKSMKEKSNKIELEYEKLKQESIQTINKLDYFQKMLETLAIDNPKIKQMLEIYNTKK